jgi:hypothetical protein
MSEMDLKPFSEDRLLDLTNAGRKRMNPLERRFWDAISIPPERWQLNPYGNFGGGFWVVGLIGRVVLWYNDIEGGFNRSRYSTYGTIPEHEYWCNQDRLEVQVRQMMEEVATGEPIGGKFGPPQPGEYGV